MKQGSPSGARLQPGTGGPRRQVHGGRNPRVARPAGYPLLVEDTQRIDISLEPLDQYVVVQPVSDETETRSGLILPASAAATAVCRTGIVTAVGSDASGIEAGDKVLYPRDAGFDVRLGGIEVKVLKREDLVARVHD